MSLNLPMFASRNRAFRALFAAGEQGVWFDPSDFGTMFQDSAGTTPVTAVGQPVGKILDKSGRGNHATQSTNTKRPTLQQDANGAYYLQFDGADDALVTGSIDLTGTDKVSIFSGLRKANDTVAIVLELGTSSATVPNTFTLVSGTSAGFSWGSVSRGNAAYNGTGQRAGVTVAAPDLAVITATHDIPGDLSRLRRNGTYGTDGTADKGTGTFGNYPLYIGARAGTSFYFNGRVYGLIVRGAESTADQITAAEFRMNNLTRAY